jgi:hypothetical protein
MIVEIILRKGRTLDQVLNNHQPDEILDANGFERLPSYAAAVLADRRPVDAARLVPKG